MKNLTVDQYVDYILETAKYIEDSKDYITSLDAATGDGDHWINMNMGYAALKKQEEELRSLDFPELFKKIGMTMMSVIGGSSGVLYGSAYLAAAKVCPKDTQIDMPILADVLMAMCEAIMTRGNSKPGDKTMVDSIEPAARTFKEGLDSGENIDRLLEKVKKSAIDGANSTKTMEAVRGRAYYQANKGVGHLDAGAVTMSYQIAILMEHIIKQ